MSSAEQGVTIERKKQKIKDRQKIAVEKRKQQKEQQEEERNTEKAEKSKEDGNAR